jgi:hypothetical protein
MPPQPASGFFERPGDAGWGAFTAYKSLPRIWWRDPNLRFVDLDGDGHADALITDDDGYWKSLGV